MPGILARNCKKKEQNIHVIYSDLSVQAAGHGDFVKVLLILLKGLFA